MSDSWGSLLAGRVWGPKSGLRTRPVRQHAAVRAKPAEAKRSHLGAPYGAQNAGPHLAPRCCVGQEMCPEGGPKTRPTTTSSNPASRKRSAGRPRSTTSPQAADSLRIPGLVCDPPGPRTAIHHLRFPLLGPRRGPEKGGLLPHAMASAAAGIRHQETGRTPPRTPLRSKQLHNNTQTQLGLGAGRARHAHEQRTATAISGNGVRPHIFEKLARPSRRLPASLRLHSGPTFGSSGCRSVPPQRNLCTFLAASGLCPAEHIQTTTRRGREQTGSEATQKNQTKPNQT